jgi:polyisoprenoid-binding protein YceI
MKSLLSVTFIILFAVTTFPQGFNVKAKGKQTFSFKDNSGRNQATFFSTTPLEDINGLTSDINGTVTFDVNNLVNGISGEIVISTASLKSGIDLRDEHIRGEKWLNAEKYPNISYKINKIENIKSESDFKLSAKVFGEFTLNGVKKQIPANVTLTYLDESEKTRKRAPGDLLGVQAKFQVKLSDFGVKNEIIGEKVADIIEVGVNMVGSNKF